MNDLYKSELLNCDEWKVFDQCKRGIMNNQSYCRIDPRQAYNICVSLDQARLKIAAVEAENARLLELIGRLVEYVGEHHIHPCIMKSVKALLEAKA